MSSSNRSTQEESSSQPLTQEKIEFFFYKIMQELRDNNIPILDDFYENFANIKFKDELNQQEEELDEDLEFNYNNYEYEDETC